LCDEISTGDEVSVDLDTDLLINHRFVPSLPSPLPPSLPPSLPRTGKRDAEPVIDVLTFSPPSPPSRPPSPPPLPSTGKEYKLQALGDAGPVIEAGGIFPFAVKTGMIEKAGV